MANVMFKRGVHANLPTTGIIDGAFYLTTDTNRLYIGQGDKLVELNKSITAVATFDNLPTTNVAVGLFYYLTDSNILCYYNGTRWVQINPDTALAAATDAIDVTTITDGAQIAVEVLDTKGNSAAGKFTIVGADDATVTVDDTNEKITITAHDTKSKIGTTASTTDAKVNLLEDDVISSTVTFKGGRNVSVTSDDAGIVTIAASDAADMTNTDANLTFDADGNLKVEVIDAGGTVEATATPTITYGDGKTAKFANGTAVLDVYDTTQVNALIRTADALVFKGAVDTIPAITTALNGDTYKLTSNITTPVTAKIGDLIIAQGTEGDNNLITTGEWIVVPSGDDQVITGEATATGIEISDLAGTIAGLTLAEGDCIDISGVVTNNTLTSTIKHGDPLAANTTVTGSTDNVAQAAKGEATYEAITEVKYDKYGHIVGVGKKTFTVVDTHNTLTDVTVTTTGGAETIGTDVVATIGVDMDDGGDSAALTFNSETLRLKQANGAVGIDLIWGSF